MDKKTHNPTPWMQGFGLNHAVEVSGHSRTLYLSGQTASAADGSPLHPGDMVAQYKSAWQCLKEALAAADMTPANLVRLNFYTTDVDGFMAAAEQIMPIHVEEGAQIVATLLGVTRLYDPAVMIELEATAVG
uniref:RidA family protein n=1 Tax=Parerythrobacter lutipelagi TaxID=1964208 RepID=UPI0010F8D7C1|nr:RidA family protein [Parerythrobacter lutipelagi]